MEDPHAGDFVTTKIKLVRPLGAGGMGSVWLADHLALHTQVVVKFIAADLARSKDAISRFEREAAAASQVKSPHVVQILDFGVSDRNSPFIVMELLEGCDLAQHIERFGRLELAHTGEITAQLCRALSRAHERGIVHRDIKPQNIFLCDAGSGELFVKLLDFGIAKGAAVEKLDESTKTGTLVGSPYYMSPEQLVGAKDIDFRTDLWSVAVVAFEAMTGTRAFEGETVGALAVRIHNDPLPIPSARCDSASSAVDAWFARACSRTPSERFGSAKELADAFIAAIGGQAPKPALTSSGAALERSGDGMALAKTAALDAHITARTPDPRVLSYSGVAKPPVRPMASRGVVFAVAFVAIATGTAITVRAIRGNDKHPATIEPTSAPTQIQIPAIPSVVPIPEIHVTTPTTEAAPVHTTPPTHTTAHVIASVAPAASSAAPSPTHTASEDDIK